jgi:hypothetical protein
VRKENFFIKKIASKKILFQIVGYVTQKCCQVGLLIYKNRNNKNTCFAH